MEQPKHIEKITSRQDLVDVLQYIWRKFEVILNRKRVAQTIYDYIINILAHTKRLICSERELNSLYKGCIFYKVNLKVDTMVNVLIALENSNR